MGGFASGRASLASLRASGTLLYCYCQGPTARGLSTVLRSICLLGHPAVCRNTSVATCIRRPLCGVHGGSGTRPCALSDLRRLKVTLLSSSDVHTSFRRSPLVGTWESMVPINYRQRTCRNLEVDGTCKLHPIRDPSPALASAVCGNCGARAGAGRATVSAPPPRRAMGTRGAAIADFVGA